MADYKVRLEELAVREFGRGPSYNSQQNDSSWVATVMMPSGDIWRSSGDTKEIAENKVAEMAFSSLATQTYFEITPGITILNASNNDHEIKQFIIQTEIETESTEEEEQPDNQLKVALHTIKNLVKKNICFTINFQSVNGRVKTFHMDTAAGPRS